jgi:hypothetical protein
MSCSIVFSQMPPNMCHLPVRCCTDPFGAAYSNVQIVIREGTINKISSLHSNMFVCGTWRRWRLIVTVLHAMQFCKVDELYNWIYVINLMLLHWLLYSELWCYLLIQGIAHLHRSSTFSKRWGATLRLQITEGNSSTQACLAFSRGASSLFLLPLHINPFAFSTCPFVFGCATDANFNLMPILSQ